MKDDSVPGKTDPEQSGAYSSKDLGILPKRVKMHVVRTNNTPEPIRSNEQYKHLRNAKGTNLNDGVQFFASLKKALKKTSAFIQSRVCFRVNSIMTPGQEAILPKLFKKGENLSHLLVLNWIMIIFQLKINGYNTESNKKQTFKQLRT